MIRHIAAIDSKGGFSKDGVIPWKLPTDEQYFTDMTKRFGGVVLMGRKTYDFIGHPLADRQNFILTRNPQFQVEGATVVHDLDAFLKQYPDVWVIGGQKLYEQTLAKADELYITEIEHEYDCDRYYPPYKDTFAIKHVSTPVTEASVTFRFKIYAPH